VRVMLVSPYSLSYVGGVQGQVLGLARALRALGVDARVVAPCDGPPPEPGIVSVGPSTGFSSNGSIAPIAPGKPASQRTLEALRNFQPDVLHLHEPLVPGPTLTALLGSSVPIVGTFHAAASEGNPWYRALRPPLRRWLQHLTLRIAVSEEARRLAQEAFGGDYEIVPNGVDVDAFAGAEPWPSPSPAVVFIGRHERRKGLEVLLDAFVGLERDAVLWVASDGPLTETLRDRGTPRVEWLGRVSDAEKARRLRGATIYCAPSLRGESFGVVLLEAMAAGVASVASDIPGYCAVARPDQEALIVPPGDVDALRGALTRLLDDPDLRADLVGAGERRAAELSMPRLAERMVPIYERAIRTPSA
jgi:phosphatidyl-myo-inositol alpha-mannosyltransferase